MKIILKSNHSIVYKKGYISLTAKMLLTCECIGKDNPKCDVCNVTMYLKAALAEVIPA